MIDIHAHILPGFDDGADDLEEAIAMAEIACGDGITHLCATPHIVAGSYTSTRKEIIAAVALLNQQLKNHEIAMEIIPGAEYRLEPDLPQRLSRGELLTINDTGKYLLVEMPVTLIPDYTEGVLYDLQIQGVTPIIAHPERSPLAENQQMLRELVKRGILAQLTGDSLSGRFGRSTEKTAWSLLQGGMAHFIASDAHSSRGRTPSLSLACQKVQDKVGIDLANELTQTNPEKVIDGQSIPIKEIQPPKSSLDFIKRLFG